MSEELITGLIDLLFLGYFVVRSLRARGRGEWHEAFYQLGWLALTSFWVLLK